MDNVIVLKCKKCGSVWSIITLKGGNDFKYALVCPYCLSSGIYDVEEVEDVSSYLDTIETTGILKLGLKY